MSVDRGDHCHSEGLQPEANTGLWDRHASRRAARERPKDCGGAVCQLQDPGTTSPSNQAGLLSRQC